MHLKSSIYSLLRWDRWICVYESVGAQITQYFPNRNCHVFQIGPEPLLFHTDQPLWLGPGLNRNLAYFVKITKYKWFSLNLSEFPSKQPYWGISLPRAIWQGNPQVPSTILHAPVFPHRGANNMRQTTATAVPASSSEMGEGDCRLFSSNQRPLGQGLHSCN